MEWGRYLAHYGLLCFCLSSSHVISFGRSSRYMFSVQQHVRCWVLCRYHLLVPSTLFNGFLILMNWHFRTNIQHHKQHYKDIADQPGLLLRQHILSNQCSGIYKPSPSSPFRQTTHIHPSSPLLLLNLLQIPRTRPTTLPQTRAPRPPPLHTPCPRRNTSRQLHNPRILAIQLQRIHQPLLLPRNRLVDNAVRTAAIFLLALNHHAEHMSPLLLLQHAEAAALLHLRHTSRA